jgi:hypothetical protein
MKIGNNKLYMTNGGSWDYQERITGWCNTKHGRSPKDKGLDHRLRRLIKSGVLDGVDLTQSINSLWKTILND